MNPDSPQPTPTQPAAAPPQAPPVTPAPPAPAGPSAAVVTGGRPSKKKAIIIGIVVAILLLAGVAYGVYAYVVNTPQNLLNTALTNLAGQKAYAGEMKYTQGTGQKATNGSGSFAFETDPTNSKNWQGSITLGASDKSFGIKALALDTTTYLKASNLENLFALFGGLDTGTESFAAMASFFKSIDNQWIELSQSDMQTIAQSSGSDSGIGVPSGTDMQKVFTTYSQHPFLVPYTVYKDEVAGGSNSAHFSVKFDKPQYIAFLQALKSANLKTVPVTDADISKAKSQPDTIQDGTVEVWVSRDTKKFTQVRMTDTKKDEESAYTITLDTKLPTFEPFQKPAGAKSFTSLLDSLVQPSLNQDELNALESNPGLLSQ